MEAFNPYTSRIGLEIDGIGSNAQDEQFCLHLDSTQCMETWYDCVYSFQIVSVSSYSGGGGGGGGGDNKSK